MNIMYSNICQKLLGEYSEKNEYYSQLLYLLCYIGEVKQETDVYKIINILKVLKKEVSIGNDVMYNKLCAECEKSDVELEYDEDFYIRCALYYHGIDFDVQLMDVNYQLGIERHVRMLKGLYKICHLYCIIMGEKDEVPKKVENKSRSNRKFGKGRKAFAARKAITNVEKQIRKNIYSLIRNKIIEFGTADA